MILLKKIGFSSFVRFYCFIEGFYVCYNAYAHYVKILIYAISANWFH